MKIAALRAETALSADSKKYDFEQRLKDIKMLEEENKRIRKEEKKKKKEGLRKKDEDEDVGVKDEEMMKMMGFGSFGGK